MSEQQRFVEFRGKKVMEGWPEELEAAQGIRTYVCEGVDRARIPFDGEKCHDCSAVAGELHVPGCDVERCPGCKGQWISCGCADLDGFDDN